MERSESTKKILKSKLFLVLFVILYSINFEDLSYISGI